MIIWRCRTQKFNFKEKEEEDLRHEEEEEEDVVNDDVFGSAENFLIGWNERRNKNGRDSEFEKVLKSNKLEDIETGQEETYESFTLQDTETEEETQKENESSLLLEPDKNLKNEALKDAVFTENVRVKKDGSFKSFLKHFK